MKEDRRRRIDTAARNLKSAETRLENARRDFAEELYAAVEEDEISLGEVSKTLKSLGRPISRQRVYQIISTVKES